MVNTSSVEKNLYNNIYTNQTDNNNIIRLQLKKPRNWNWELSTSKSSPNLVLPFIQLLDAKGRLILDTSITSGTIEDGVQKRQCWNSTKYCLESTDRWKGLTRKNCNKSLSPKNIGVQEENVDFTKVYKTRTCRAGTLIITGESFSEIKKNRRCRPNPPQIDEEETRSTEWSSKGYSTATCKGNDEKSPVRDVHRRCHHVTMGSNVSRDLTKGFSGRRSQSSGSICTQQQQNGKSSGKVTGSLPSYLDENRQIHCQSNEGDKSPIFDGIYQQQQHFVGDGSSLQWKFSDTQTVLYDQGYASERSPENDQRMMEPQSCYPFITQDSMFVVKLVKSSRGLGLSVTGGVDCGGSWPGLIRIKRLFPHQPAANCGFLNIGDLLLAANGVPLMGLSNYEALEVLRTSTTNVELTICRPPPDVLNCVSPISEVPPPPPQRREPTPSFANHAGVEFEVLLEKINGSLGFTLRKEDSQTLGHYIRALVREPALTDGRLQTGDRIIAVNDTELAQLTHEQAVQFLRKSGNVVKLRLFREPVSPSDTATTRSSFCVNKKPSLRQEAVDMLNDIAVRRLISDISDIDSPQLPNSPTMSPSTRRLRRRRIIDEQFHEGLLIQQQQQQQHQHHSLNGNGSGGHRLDDEAFNSLFVENEDEEYEDFDDDDDDDDEEDDSEELLVSRPSSLDLYNPNQTPVVCRKPRFNFSLAHNAYELNNLDAEVLDAPNPTYNIANPEDLPPNTNNNSNNTNSCDNIVSSMPYLPCDEVTFTHKNPIYQSAHPHCDTKSDSVKASDEGTQIIDNEHTPNEVVEIELNRGWNSRLGFSLRGVTGGTYVSAVYSNSVAAKDGRIRPGDRLIKVNEESVEQLSTAEIIELLRILRGPIALNVIRNVKRDCEENG